MKAEHLSPDEALRFLAGDLDEDHRRRVEDHIDRCPRCRRFLSALARVTLGARHASRWQSPTGPDAPLPRSKQEAAWLLLSSLRGQVLNGRFEVIDELGFGGMGVVVEVFDRRTKRNLALKTMTQLNPKALYQFKQEFRQVRDLRHPNLVQLEELHVDGDLWFFTMERVRGRPFLEYVRGPAARPLVDLLAVGESEMGPSRVDWGRLRRALGQCAEALSALHAEGLVHRDIKPTNVLVDGAQRVVVLDFGLVARAKGPVSPIEEGENSEGLIGTPRYMAPEQPRGEEASPASDWYAMGVMLYEALTGRPPYEGSGQELLRRKQRPLERSPRDLAPDTPPDLDELCRKLLAVDPRARAGAAEIRSACQPAGPMGAPSGRSVGFIGRTRELAQLITAFEASRDEPRWVLVSGEPGIGKTALVGQAIHHIRRRDPKAIILSGRSRAHERVPFKGIDPIVDGLTQYLLRWGPELEALLNEDLRFSAHLFPVLRQISLLADIYPPGTSTADPSQVRLRGFLGLQKLLGALSERRPLVILADDIQWAGADSFAFFETVLGSDRLPPFLFLATARTAHDAFSEAEEDTPLVPERLLARFDRLDVKGLDPQASFQVAAELAPLASPEARGAAIQETRGHPLFLGALSVRMARGWARASLYDVLWEEIHELPAPERGLLTALVIAGRPLSTPSLARFLDAEPADIEREGESLRRRRLVRVFEGPEHTHLEVFHDRVREVVEVAIAREMHPEVSEGWVLKAKARLGRVVLEQAEGRRADVVLAARLLTADDLDLSPEDRALALDASLLAARAGQAATSAPTQREYARRAVTLARQLGDDERLRPALRLLLEAQIYLLEREGAAQTMAEIVEGFAHDSGFVHRAWLLKTNAESTIGLAEDAVESVDRGLKHLGRRGLPPRVSGLYTMAGYIWWRRRGLAFADASVVPLDTEERVRHARTLELLSAAIYPASFRSKTFFPYLAYRILHESQRYGYRLETTVGVGLLGVLAFYPVGEIKVAEAHHAVVAQAIERWGDVPAMAFYMMGEATLFRVWKEGPLGALPRMMAVRTRCLELGDLRSSAAASAHLVLQSICGGRPVPEARAMVPDAYAGALHQPALAAAVAYSEAWLAGLAEEAPAVSVPEMDPHLNLGLSDFYRVFYAAFDAYLAGHWEEAAKGIDRLDDQGDIADGLIIWSLVHVVRVLVVTAVGRHRRRSWRQARYLRRSLARLATFAKMCPLAFEGPHLLARAALQAQKPGGLQRLDEAIERCRQDHHHLAETLGHHLKLSLNESEATRAAARCCFQRFGAPRLIRGIDIST